MVGDSQYSLTWIAAYFLLRIWIPKSLSSWEVHGWQGLWLYWKLWWLRFLGLAGGFSFFSSLLGGRFPFWLIFFKWVETTNSFWIPWILWVPTMKTLMAIVFFGRPGRPCVDDVDGDLQIFEKQWLEGKPMVFSNPDHKALFVLGGGGRLGVGNKLF